MIRFNSFFKFLSNRKLYTSINLFGLAVSLMFVILIADFSYKMLNVDRSHPRKDDIFLLGKGSGGYSSSYPNGTEIAEMFPEIESKLSVIGSQTKGFNIKENTVDFHILMVDSTFFDFFAFPSIFGDVKQALSGQDKAVITESLALKLFGKVDAVGENLTLLGHESSSFTVSAVIKDLRKTVLPNNTDIIVRVENAQKIVDKDVFSRYRIVMGGINSCKIFFMKYPDADLNEKIPDILKYLQENDLDYKLSNRTEVTLTPLDDLMLDENCTNEGFEHGNRQILIILLTAAIAILLFAITNYINLTVAQTGFRAREMACRRLLGESGNGVTLRLIFESTFMTLVAFIVGFFLAIAFEQQASILCGAQLNVVSDLSGEIVVIYLLFILIVGIVSGIIPAYTLSRYKPIDIVKGTLRYRSKMVFSKVFLIFQNVITIVMVISSITIYFQIQHLCNAPLGHNSKDIIELIDWEMNKSQIVSFKNEISALPYMEGVGLGKSSSFFNTSRSMQSFKDKDGKERWMTIMGLDSAAVEILGLEKISDYHPAAKAIYLNEEAMRQLGISSDDREISYDISGSDKQLLGGIYKDFKLGTILEDSFPIIITPMDLKTVSDTYTPGITFYIKVSGSEKIAYKEIEDKFAAITGYKPKIMSYGEDVIKRNFANERNISTIILIFSIIAIIISALGLFAMSTFFTRGRIKEIGIRRIFGSTRKEILLRQLWSLVSPLLISFILSIPIAYIIIDKWLQSYSYRMEQSPWIYIFSAIFVLLIGLCTVLGQSLKAVNENPVKAIRVE